MTVVCGCSAKVTKYRNENVYFCKILSKIRFGTHSK